MSDTARPEVLVAASLPPVTMAALGLAFTTYRLSDEDALARVRGMAASTLAGPIGPAMLDRLPALEVIANFGVGYDNIDVAAAVERGIVVTNTAGVLDEEVADLTLGLLLATLRRIPAAERFLRDGLWAKGSFALSPSLRGRRVGIVGLGGIGKAVARRLEGFAVEIAYHGRSRQADVAYPWYPTVVALAQACDVLIVIVPGGASTRHMIDAQVLEALGPAGVLINVSRGTVVDEPALVAALEAGSILAAGLDVFEREPVVPGGLLALDNVVLLPHVGSGSVLTRAAMGQAMVDNLSAWFASGDAPNVVPETRHLIRGL